MILKIILLLLILPFIYGQSINETEDDLITSYIRRDLGFADLVKYDGYEPETHTVTTSDGYILTLFRVKSQCETTGKPVIFMHGLYLSSDDCIISGPGVGLCYLLADACRDVWAPNVRGNVYGRNHTTLDPDTDAEFWNFAVEEMAYYDMPVFIDYVLNQTGSDQVYFVGHSQGVTMLLLLCAKYPEYNNKIKAGFGLSTTGWLDHARFIVVILQGIIKPLLTPLVNAGLNTEFLPRDGFYQPFIKAVCGTTSSSYEACSQLYFLVLGYDQYQVTPAVFRVLTGHLPSGTSLKNFNRWGQIRDNGFTQYDYGLLGNMKAYNGRLTPPEFDLSQITMNWYFIGSENDYVSDILDLDVLISKVANSVKCVLSDTTFGHLDFNYGKDIPNLIFPSILGYMENETFVCL